jgi:polyisoprenoid-binding protein YceI
MLDRIEGEADCGFALFSFGVLNMRPLLLVLPLLFTVPILAQSGQMQPPGAKLINRVSAGDYSADPSHTLIGWRVNHLGFNDYFGIFGDVSGTLSLDPKNPNAAKVDVTIPIGKVTTASMGLTEHLLRAGKDGGKPDFFGPNPADATFVSTSVVAKEAKAKITGNLTLNGITKPVILNAEFSGAGTTPQFMGGKETVGFHGKAAIKRSDFGLTNGIPFVTDNVQLDITVAFEKVK